MRESIGGAWLYYLVVTFLLIYVFFMSFIMNYASTSRAANYVINQIEACQARNGDCKGNSVKEITEAIWNKYRYRVPKNRKLELCCKDNGNGSVYRVTLPVEFNVPFIGSIETVSVKAETKTIQNISCQSDMIGYDRKC